MLQKKEKKTDQSQMSSFLMCFFYAFKILLEIRVAAQT